MASLTSCSRTSPRTSSRWSSKPAAGWGSVSKSTTSWSPDLDRLLPLYIGNPRHEGPDADGGGAGAPGGMPRRGPRDRKPVRNDRTLGIQGDLLGGIPG